jgi:hypothetical protein
MTKRIESIRHTIRTGQYLTDRKLTVAIDRMIPDLFESQDPIQAHSRQFVDPAPQQLVSAVPATSE